MINKMKQWLDAATPAQKARLAELADTSVKHLSFLAADDDKQHSRRASPEMAMRLEKAMVRIASTKAGRYLPVFFREELNDTCAACSYARCCGQANKRGG